jgi:hypothetical protein
VPHRNGSGKWEWLRIIMQPHVLIIGLLALLGGGVVIFPEQVWDLLNKILDRIPGVSTQ